jgi:hypothetical protein
VHSNGQDVSVVDRCGSLLDGRLTALIHHARICLDCTFPAFTNSIIRILHCAVNILITVGYVVFFPVIATLRVMLEQMRHTVISVAEGCMMR